MKHLRLVLPVFVCGARLVSPPLIEDEVSIHVVGGFLRPVSPEQRCVVLPMGPIPKPPHQESDDCGVTKCSSQHDIEMLGFVCLRPALSIRIVLRYLQFDIL